jgi:hypothetical protein
MSRDRRVHRTAFGIRPGVAAASLSLEIEIS